ncbi:MAG: hypothetical protein ACXU9A_12710 [Xanthobacteraceae bacterium]
MRNGRKLTAHFRKRHAGADIRDRSNLDGLDEALEHSVEKLDLLGIETAGGRQKKICNAPDRGQALFGRADLYGGFDFVDDR